MRAFHMSGLGALAGAEAVKGSGVVFPNDNAARELRDGLVDVGAGTKSWPGLDRAVLKDAELFFSEGEARDATEQAFIEGSRAAMQPVAAEIDRASHCDVFFLTLGCRTPQRAKEYRAAMDKFDTLLRDFVNKFRRRRGVTTTFAAEKKAQEQRAAAGPPSKPFPVGLVLGIFGLITVVGLGAVFLRS